MTNTKRVMTTVTQAELTAAQGGVGGGDYTLTVECPADYDASEITAEDIVHDDRIVVVEETTMTTTVKNLTDSQISKLRTEATAAGDYVMGAICDLALTGSFSGDDYTTLSRAETKRVAGMDRDAAYAAVATAINAARAQED